MTSLSTLIKTLLASPFLHAKWLNTLSYLENSGARLLAAAQHPYLVRKEMLKHAEEEFRHAHYLKKQINKLGVCLEDYTSSLILGKYTTRNYLARLNLYTCRFLKKKGLSQSQLQACAYLFVTYAIEMRAKEVYPLYETLLREKKIPIYVQSIVLEEAEHLREMKTSIEQKECGEEWAFEICQIEQKLFAQWVNKIENEITAQSEQVRHF